MLKRIIWVFLCCWLSSAYATQPTILVMGDSLSAAYGISAEQGWAQLLQRRLSAADYPHQVINDSVSGDTTHNALARLPNVLSHYQPTVVILELGGNDGLRGLSLQKMQANLSQMVELVQKQGAKVLLLGMRIPPNYGPLYTQHFEKVFRDVAEQYKIAFEPFFLSDVADQPDLMQNDGIHPNATAQPLMLEKVWDDLKPLLNKAG